MGKPLLFYLIDEHTDDIKYCEQKGMVPCKFADKELDGNRIKAQFSIFTKGIYMMFWKAVNATQVIC